MSEEYYLWVARDKCGCLCLYDEKPKKLNDKWWRTDGYMMFLDRELFPNVKWEDKEPLAVVLQQAIFKSK